MPEQSAGESEQETSTPSPVMAPWVIEWTDQLLRPLSELSESAVVAPFDWNASRTPGITTSSLASGVDSPPPSEPSIERLKSELRNWMNRAEQLEATIGELRTERNHALHRVQGLEATVKDLRAENESLARYIARSIHD